MRDYGLLALAEPHTSLFSYGLRRGLCYYVAL